MAADRKTKAWEIVKVVNSFRWVVVWFFGLPFATKAVGMLIPLALLYFSIVKSLPWPILMFFGLASAFLIALFVVAFSRDTKATPCSPEIEIKHLALTLIPHGDNDRNVYLEVCNLSDSAHISAQIRVLSKSYGEGVKKYAYNAWWSGPIYSDGNWSNPQHKRDHGKKTSVCIDKDKSHRLRIAEVEPEDGYGISMMSLVAIDESLKWDFEPTPNSHLPFFLINIKLFGEGFTNIISKDYKVGPKTFRGPMGMTEVSV